MHYTVTCYTLLLNLIYIVPSLKQLYEHITPHFAADWKEIGVMLNLPTGELKAIAMGNPTNVKWCCNSMLEKWLDIDTTASWEKILAAVNSSAVTVECECREGMAKIAMAMHENA